MEYIRVTKENLEEEHICCAISNNKDVQMSRWATRLKIAIFCHDLSLATCSDMLSNISLQV